MKNTVETVDKWLCWGRGARGTSWAPHLFYKYLFITGSLLRTYLYAFDGPLPHNRLQLGKL